MNAVLILVFLTVALIAAAFAVWPVIRRKEDSRPQRAVLASAAALLTLGVGGGLYVYLGSPGLALRTLAGPKNDDLAGLVSKLVGRVRADPNDERAWELLGRGYLTLGVPGQAADAFRHAAMVATPIQQPDLLDSYGEALTLANNGQVPDQALAAFHAALDADPKNAAARYYIGLALADRHQPDKALAIWQQLLDDSPPDAPYRSMLIDRIASLKAGEVAAGHGEAPNIAAMVEKLAGSLKAAPNNPAGWQRLIRAYSVLGDAGKAKAALSDARAALKSDPAALSAIETEAKSLGLGS